MRSVYSPGSSATDVSSRRGDSRPLLAGASVDTPPRLTTILSFLSSTMTPIGQSAGVGRRIADFSGDDDAHLRRAAFDRGVGGDAHRQAANRQRRLQHFAELLHRRQLASWPRSPPRGTTKVGRARTVSPRVFTDDLDAPLAAGAIGFGRLEAEQVIAGQLAAESIERDLRRRR